jgi:hypothetical protein
MGFYKILFIGYLCRIKFWFSEEILIPVRVCYMNELHLGFFLFGHEW